MRIKYLGQPIVDGPRFKILEVVSSEDDRVIETMPIPVPVFLRLGNKRYAPVQADGKLGMSEEGCRTTLDSSASRPQRIAPVVQGAAGHQQDAVRHAMENRLWVFRGKAYELDTNDCTEEEVRRLLSKRQDREATQLTKLGETQGTQ